jgi:hypothetical protein
MIFDVLDAFGHVGATLPGRDGLTPLLWCVAVGAEHLWWWWCW